MCKSFDNFYVRQYNQYTVVVGYHLTWRVYNLQDIHLVLAGQNYKTFISIIAVSQVSDLSIIFY